MPDNGNVKWGWLGKIVAGVVITGIPGLLYMQWRADKTRDELLMLLKSRQEVVIETLKDDRASIMAIEKHLSWFRSETDVGWQAIKRDILELQFKLQAIKRDDVDRRPR